jgi:hypothetical protein
MRISHSTAFLSTLYPQKLALTSPISGGLSVGIVRSWTQATELSYYFSDLMMFFFEVSK